MNAGFSNLFTLKANILPPAIQADTQFDPMITSIAQGVAASFEKFCNRKFLYTANDTYTCSSDRTYISLPRFPITGVSQINQSDTADSSWQSLGSPTDAALNIILPTGIIEFGYILGPYFSRLQIIYSGGLFWETLEPTDEGFPSAQPEGVEALPADIMDAWVEQVMFMFTARDILGQRAIKKSEKASVGDYRFATIDLLDHVQTILAQHIRYSV